MAKSRGMLVPIGLLSSATAPLQPNDIGDSYFDTTIGAIQTWNGSAWVGVSAIDHLTDVDTTTVAPVLDDVLKYDGAMWVPAVVSGVPTGSIIAFGGATAPQDWALCDGSPHGSPDLLAVLGSPNTPNLVDRFIIGTGTNALNATGGVASVALSEAESGLRSHNHTGGAVPEGEEHTHLADPPYTQSVGVNVDHSHGINLGGGDHGHAYYGSKILTDEGDFNPAGGGYRYLTRTHEIIDGGGHGHVGQTAGHSTDHSHGVEIPGFWTGGRSAVHTHGVTVNAVAGAAATAAHENRPPFYALTYIIKL